MFLRILLVCLALYTTTAFAQETTPEKPLSKADTVKVEEKAKKPDAAELVIIPPEVDAATRRAKRAIKTLQTDLEKYRKVVDAPDAKISVLESIRPKLVELSLQILQAQNVLKNPIDGINARIKGLGAAPKKDETEPKAVAAQRKSLENALGQLESANKQMDVLNVAVGELDNRISQLQRKAFVARVFDSSRSVLNPAMWFDWAKTIPDIVVRTKSVVDAWLVDTNEKALVSARLSFFFAMLVPVLVLLGLIYIWRKMSAPPARLGSPDELRRVWRAVGGILLASFLVFFGLVAVTMVLSLTAISDPRIARLVDVEAGAVLAAVYMISVLRAILAPGNCDWRLINRNNEAASRLFNVGTLAALVYGADVGLSGIAEVTFMPLVFTIGVHALSSIFLIILLAVFIATARNGEALIPAEQATTRRFYFGWSGKLFLFGWLALLVSALALIFGYIALASFITNNILLTASFVIGLYLLHHFVDAFVTSSTQEYSRAGRILRKKMGLENNTIRRIGLLLSTTTDIGVILIGIPLVLSSWAINWVDFSSLASKYFFGFKVGDLTIEPSRILLAIGFLIVGLIVARLFEMWLENRILKRTELDTGVSNSIATGAKYTLIILVIGFALTAAGLDFSKLAIVAGALSVGIGFGLQSVVSNFVSGLILLAERPIRIGDWIKVSSGEGIVQQINVRSTIIRTFDRCRVIIPNSSLISEPVDNWSLGSPIGRIKINIGVGYDSDPREVEKILLECGSSHDQVIFEPSAPRVIFTDFGASSLDFQLRLFIRDIDSLSIVSSDLRFSIFAALKQAGIEIPFPQRDINIRDIDRLEKLVKPQAAKTRAGAKSRAGK